MNGIKLEKGIVSSLNSGDQIDLIDPSNVEGKIFRKFILYCTPATYFHAEIYTNNSGCPNHLAFKFFFDGVGRPATVDY